jgi:hypothetical protein
MKILITNPDALIDSDTGEFFDDIEEVLNKFNEVDGQHLHCCLFLFLAIIMLLKMVLPVSWGLDGWLNLAAFLYIVYYVFKSLREVYKRSRLVTAMKIGLMMLSYFVVFVVCISMMFLVTAMIVPN